MKPYSSRTFRVCVAGPIRLGSLHRNVNAAVLATLHLAAKGYAPLCPQLSAFTDSPAVKVDGDRCFTVGTVLGGLSHSEWMRIDLPWVAVSDFVCRLPGESVGADEECAFAESLGIPVCSLADLLGRPPLAAVAEDGVAEHSFAFDLYSEAQLEKVGQLEAAMRFGDWHGFRFRILSATPDDETQRGEAISAAVQYVEYVNSPDADPRVAAVKQEAVLNTRVDAA